jgi:hypothetical protein
VDPHLLIVTAGERHYREYLLRSISRHYRVHLFLDAEPTWERAYLDGWTVLDTVDTDAVIAAAVALSTRDPLHGVVSWDETRIAGAAAAAAALGLPAGDPETIGRCRDKHLTRVALAERGVPQPASTPVRTLDEALAAARATGYPAVLKPRALAGSIGVTIVRTPRDMPAAFAYVDRSHESLPEVPDEDRGILLEEYADGPEISIDAAVFRGEVHPICLARKQVGFPPYFEETGHVVDVADDLARDPYVIGILRDTHAALGFTDGMTHTELRLTPAGPKVIELNARIGGDLIPYLGLLTGGTDPGLAAAGIACGRAPRLATRRRGTAAVRFFYPPADDTVIGAVRVDGGLPPAIDRFTVLARPGETMSPPPKGLMVGRVAYATAVAADRRECLAALDEVESRIRIEAGPPR